MNKKSYVSPQIETIDFDSMDIVTKSSGCYCQDYEYNYTDNCSIKPGNQYNTSMGGNFDF